MIENFGSCLSAVLVTIIHTSDKVKKILISQLINGISRGLQKLLKYFNGIIIWTSFVPSFPVWPVNFSLDLNEVVSGLSGTSVITYYCLQIVHLYSTGIN